MKRKNNYQSIQIGDADIPVPSYQEELKWLRWIEEGTLHLHKTDVIPRNLYEQVALGSLVASKEYRQWEYAIVASAGLACRAAIRGGVSEFDAFAREVSFQQELMECKSIKEMLSVYEKALRDYSLAVCDLRKKHTNRWNYVERCKEYVAKNRTRKLTAQEIAEELDISLAHLEREFKKAEGITVYQYVLEQKLIAAVNIIKYSEAKIGDVAAYLGFDFQSHMSAAFKCAYGMTPLQYRKDNQPIQFSEGYTISQSGQSYLGSEI